MESRDLVEIWDTHQIATIQALVNTAIQRYSGADSNVGCPDIYVEDQPIIDKIPSLGP
jgi:hypothetical protein